MPKSDYPYPGFKDTAHGFFEPRPGSKGGIHAGEDSAAPADTPVVARYTGTVFRSGLIHGYGMAVVVQSYAADGKPFFYVYGHLGPGPLPPPNTQVTEGQPIPGAFVGDEKFVKESGAGPNYKGTHVHRDIISGQAPINKTGNFGIFSSDRATSSSRRIRRWFASAPS